MAFNFSDRNKRGEIIVPYVLKKVWQDRESETGTEDQLRYMRILRKFVEQDIAQMEEQGDHHTFKGYLHPSSLGGCMRQQWFKLMGVEEQSPDSVENYCRKERIFANGDMMHLRWAALFEYSGILTGREKVIRDDERKIIGKRDADVTIPDEGDFIVDFKTSNPIFYDQMVKAGSPGDGYVAQINVYMHYANIHKGAVIVENKANQDVVEFPVLYDKVLVDSLLERASEILEAVRLGNVPEKEFTEMNRPPCSWCGWQGACNTPTMIKAIEASNDKTKREAEPSSEERRLVAPNRKLLLERVFAKKR